MSAFDSRAAARESGGLVIRRLLRWRHDYVDPLGRHVAPRLGSLERLVATSDAIGDLTGLVLFIAKNPQGGVANLLVRSQETPASR
jgi:hypothetical protein